MEGIKQLHVFVSELDIHRSDIFLQVADVFGARDGDKITPLDKHPGQGNLSRGGMMARSDTANDGDNLQVLTEIITLEAWRPARKSSGESCPISWTVLVRKPRPRSA
jgi:hypothetical protein